MSQPKEQFEVEKKLQVAINALADIAFSDDMTLGIARRKAERVYNELSPSPVADPSKED